MQEHKHWYQSATQLVVPITTEENTDQHGSAAPGSQAFLVYTQSIQKRASSSSHSGRSVFTVLFWSRGRTPPGPSSYWLKKMRSCGVRPIIRRMCRRGNHRPRQPCTLLTMAYQDSNTHMHTYVHNPHAHTHFTQHPLQLVCRTRFPQLTPYGCKEVAHKHRQLLGDCDDMT